MSTRTRLHRLVDDLPEAQVDAAEKYLEYLSLVSHDPFLQALLNAPCDAEPETDEDREAVREARSAIMDGDVVSDAELRAQLGL